MKIITRFFLFILFVFPVATQAQISFVPLDENVEYVPTATTGSEANSFYTLGHEYGIGYDDSRLLLKQWNGLFWVEYPPFFAGQMQTATENRMALCLHQNKVYAGASFTTRDNKQAGVVRWNTDHWEAVNGGITSDFAIHPEISVSKMISYKNDLFVCGEFNRTMDGKKLQNFAVLQSDTWRAVITNNGFVRDMQIWRDTLIAVGKFNTIGGSMASNVAASFNGKWMSFSKPNSDEFIATGLYNGSLVLVSPKNVFLYDGSSWSNALQNWNYTVNRIGSMVEFDGKLYVAGIFTSATGTRVHLLRWDGMAWAEIVTEKNVVPSGQSDYFINKRGNDLFFSGNMTSFFGEKVNHVVMLHPGKTIVRGKVFEDINENCAFDAGDVPQANAIISVNEGQSYSSTDENGDFYLVLPVNSKTGIRVFPSKTQVTGCQPDYREINSVGKDTTVIVQFPLFKKPEPAKPDLSFTSATGYKARHGYTSNYSLRLLPNKDIFPARVKLIYDPRLSGFETQVNATVLNNGEISWDLSTEEEVNFSMIVDHEKVRVGDTLRFTAELVSSKGTRTEHLEQIVVAALDPNAKQCSKDKITEKDRSLEYHIQFQNLGNDSAVNIHVVDTISNSLPMQYIQILNYSHPQNYKVGFKVRDHAIIWSFNDIMLAPKSQAGDAGSSGFITFHAGLIADLKVGQKVQNQAHIYFDYQPAVATNTIVTEVVEPRYSSLDPADQLQVKPNPSNGIFQLDFAPNTLQKVEVYDRNGNLVLTSGADRVSSTATIDLSAFSSGVYLVKVTHATGVVSKKIVLSK